MKTFFFLLTGLFLGYLSYAQTALPDLKLEMRDFECIKSKYPSQEEISNRSRPYEFRLVQGDIINFTFYIENKGQAPSGAFTVEATLANTVNKKTEYQTFTQNFPSLDPGKETWFNQHVTIKTDYGDLSYKARISRMEKDDYNTNDNILEDTGSMLVWSWHTVDKYLLPDFSVTLTSPDPNRHIQRTVKLLATVTNKGKSNSAPTTMVLKCKDKNTKTENIPALKPGESFSHEFQHKWPTTGSKKCELTVDPQNKVREKDENNNSVEMKINIKL